jgi:RNA polymerase sigma factor (sigma-70 family)
MPPKDSQPPPARGETMPPSPPVPSAMGGGRAIVRDLPPEEPDEEEPEEPAPRPTTIIVPPGQHARDRAAFMTWLDANWGAFILKTVLAQGGVSEESTKDLRQEVLLILCEQYDKHVAPTHVMRFLERVIENETANHLRRWKVPIDRGADLDAEVDPGHSPESAAALAEQWDSFQRFLDQLTPAEAEVVEARELHGLTFKQIAEVLGRPLPTVVHQHARGLEKLQELARASEQATALDARRPAGR